MNQRTIIITVVLVFILAGVVALRSSGQKRSFNQLVAGTLKATAGYDQQFLALVNRLEEELATRAQFGYKGQNDPMTGITRTIVKRQAAAPAATAKKDEAIIRLAALVADANGQTFSAVLMLGERSYAVGRGDMVGEYKVTEINKDGVFLEKAGVKVFYDTQGRSY